MGDETDLLVALAIGFFAGFAWGAIIAVIIVALG